MNNNIFNYLFFKSETPFKNKWFNSIILKTDSKDNNISNILDVYREILGYIEVANCNDEIIIIYFNDIDISLEDITLSICDDFGISISLFSMPRIYARRNKFLEIYSLYSKYLSGKKQGFYYTKDIIFESLKVDTSDTIALKKILLDKILDDPQNETLILSLFANNLNVSKTSSNIYMHRNTINNRLEIIKRECGLNLQNFQDAVAMFCLMKLK